MFSRQLLPRIQMPRFRRALAAFYVFQTPFKHLFWIDLSYCDIQSLTMHHMRARHRPLTTEQMQGFLIADVRSLESAQSCEV